MLAPAELAARVAVRGAHGATFTPHCARIQPARLVRGLADVVERLGVHVYERTAVRAIVPRCARAEAGDVRARLGGARDRGLHRRSSPASAAPCCR